MRGSESGRVELEGGCRSNPPSTAMSLYVVASHPPCCTQGRVRERQNNDVNDNMEPPQIPRAKFFEDMKHRIKEQAESAKAKNPTTSTASNSAKSKPTNSKSPSMSMKNHTEMPRDRSGDEGARYPRTLKGSSSRSRSEHEAINRLLSRKC